MNNLPPKLISFVGRSNSGKTTLITQLIPMFVKMGLKIGTIKNTHHIVQFDKPGKDSWAHAQAGSSRVVVTSGENLAVFEKSNVRPSAVDLSNQWFQDFDLVISEGFKNDDCLKIEVYREMNNKEPLYLDSIYNIRAVVSDTRPSKAIQHFNFEELDQIASWILSQLMM